jgi:hypothetical protein
MCVCFQVLSRTIRVDHVNDYKPPKDNKYTDEETKKLRTIGCAPGTEFGSILPVKTEDIKQGMYSFNSPFLQQSMN